MNKAVLVIDMPNVCWQCPFCETWDVIPSVEEYSCTVKNIEVDKYRKPDWCPLKPMPRMRFTYMDHDNDAILNYNNGWNDCIGKIVDE